MIEFKYTYYDIIVQFGKIIAKKVKKISIGKMNVDKDYSLGALLAGIDAMTMEAATEYSAKTMEQMQAERNSFEKYEIPSQQEIPGVIKSDVTPYKISVYEADMLEEEGFVIWNAVNHNYYNFRYPEQIEMFTNKHKPEARTFHERIPENGKRKIAMDIDGGLILGAAGVERIRDCVIEAFWTLYSVCLNDWEIMICDSSGPGKKSYHIIIKGYCVDSYKEAKLFAEAVRDMLPGEIGGLIDIGHYKTRTGLRLAGSRAISDMTRFKKIPVGYTFLDTLVTYTEGCRLVSSGRDFGEKPVIDVEILPETIPAIIRAVPPHYLDGQKFREAKKGCALFDRVKSTKCYISGRQHDHDNTVYIIVGNGRLTLKCRHCDSDGIVIRADGVGVVVKPDGAAVKKPRAKKPIADRAADVEARIKARCDAAVVKRELSVEGTVVKYVGTLNERGHYMIKYPVSKGRQTLMVVAPMGAGKTKALIEYLDELRPASVMMGSIRRVFAAEMAIRVGLKSYMNITGDIASDKHPRVIVQCESFRRIEMPTKYSVVILDEIESICDQFFAQTNNDRITNGSIFLHLIRSCDHLVCMDAHLTQRTIDFIQSVRSAEVAPIMLHINEAIISRHQNYIATDFVSAQQKVFDILAEGGRVVIPTSSRKWSVQLHGQILARFPDKKIKIYNSDTPADVKDADFADVNEAWDGLDVLIYTPTILAGVSFERENFTHAVCFWKSNTTHVYNCLQMKNRVRNISSGIYVHYVRDEASNLMETPEDILKHVSISIQNGRDYEMPVTEFKYDNGIVYNMTDMLRLWFIVKARQNYSRNHFLDTLINELKLSGGTVEPLKMLCDEPVRKDLAAANLQTTAEIKAAEHKAIIESVELSYEEYKELKHKTYISADLRPAMQKYRFRKHYDFQGDLTEHLLNKHGTPKAMTLYRRRKRIESHGDPWDVLKCLRTYERSFNQLDIDNVKQILNTNRDEFCLMLLKKFGLTFGSTKIMKKEEVARIFTELHDELSKPLNLQFEIDTFGGSKIYPKKSDKLFLQKMLKRYNAILDGQYGISIAAINHRRSDYHLKDNFKKLYDENWHIKI